MEGLWLIPNMYSPLIFSTLSSFLLKDVGPVRSSIIVDEIQKLLIHCCIGIQNGVLNICSLFDLLLMSQKFSFGACYVGVPSSLSLTLFLSVSVGSTSNLVRRRDSEHHWFNHRAPTNLVLRHSYSLFLTTTRVFVIFQIRFADSRVSCSFWLYQVWKWWNWKSAVGYVHIFAILCLLFSVITAHLCFLSFLVMQKNTSNLIVIFSWT